MSVRSTTKEEKQFAVSKAIFEIIDNDGLLGVTHSNVSRKSGVSRAWLYEYIGKEKSDLIAFATEVFGERFARTKVAIPKNREQLWTQLGDGVGFVFDNIANDPAAIKIYFRFRGSKNKIGDIIKKYEKHWLDLASKCATDVLGLPQDVAILLAELLLTIRLGYAHRIASAAKPLEARANAEKTFSLIHGFIGGLG